MDTAKLTIRCNNSVKVAFRAYCVKNEVSYGDFLEQLLEKRIDGTLYFKCTKCNAEKVCDDFRKTASSKTGYRTECKECSRKYDRKRRERIEFATLMERMGKENDIKN